MVASRSEPLAENRSQKQLCSGRSLGQVRCELLSVSTVSIFIAAICITAGCDYDPRTALQEEFSAKGGAGRGGTDINCQKLIKQLLISPDV